MTLRFVILEIDSSSIGQIKYDPTAEELYVEFYDSGRHYMYADVTKKEFTELLHADSIGKHIVEEIIPSKDATEMIDDNE